MVKFDEFGPEKIITVYDAKVGMKGYIVLDNLVLGPAKGGIRMTPTVTIDEVSRLARAMTWKCALAEIPFGGGKSGIVLDDKQVSKEKKKEVVESFARAIKIISPEQYIPAPDMNMAEEEMKLIAKVNGDDQSVTGKPRSMNGLPHELGSTGYGVYHATDVAASYAGLKLKGSTVAIEGFGNVGQFAAQFITEHGAKIIAVSDSHGLAHNQSGLDYKKLMDVKKKTGSVVNYGVKHKECDNILHIKADILITAAIPDLIKVSDIDSLKFKLIVQGSNIPMTTEVEEICHKKGILVIPDFIANAGGVISSYVEYIGGNEPEMFEMVKQKIRTNTKIVLDKVKKNKTYPRATGLEIAKERVRKKCKVCKI